MKFQIFINNRDYTSWDFKDVHTETIVDIEKYDYLKNIDPISNKLFSRDILTFNDNNEIVDISSLVKHTDVIAGILILEGNNTYGRVNNKKMLYKCIPDDKYLPSFLVPYELKIGFSKKILNKYVIFKYNNWNNKHPLGSLVNTLGDVDNLEVFYEYQLYCKSLCISLNSFTNNTKKVLGKTPHSDFIRQILNNPNFIIEDRRDRRIITIDPSNSVDYDDGLGIEPIMNDLNIQIGWTISIYIANVFVWLETLGLWDTFSHRVATIYLPDRKRPMLPTILSDTLCSLQENKERFALVIDIDVDINGCFTDNFKYKNVLIKPYKNYVYEEKNLIFNEPIYKKIYDVTNLMDKEINNSYDLVAYWMIYMNALTGINMLNKKVGIFRSVIIQNNNSYSSITDTDISLDAKRAIKHWNNISGHYIYYNDNINLNHDLINISQFNNNVQPYIHITSPIRRIIDLLNQIILFKKFKIVREISLSAQKFVDYWLSKLDYVNTSMRSIKKIQTDCNLLYNCTNNPIYLDIEHTGIIFDKMKRNNGYYNYTVYLEKLKIMSKFITALDLPEYSKQNFKLYLFESEEKIKKKIKLQIIL